MAPHLPIKKRWISTDKAGRTCVIEVSVEQTRDITFYPPFGLKCVFKMLRERSMGHEDFEIVLLIDNHEPFGFHVHKDLPGRRDLREALPISDWQEAWSEFEKRMTEIRDET